LCDAELRDKRYDCVLHLVTAANGAEPFYTLQGNAARTEGAGEARDVDRRLMGAWMGHPAFILVDNVSVGLFEEKLERVTYAALGFAGLKDIRTMAGVQRRKFVLVQSAKVPSDVNLNVVRFHVEHTMLHASEDGRTFHRLRSRRQLGSLEDSSSPPVYTLASSRDELTTNGTSAVETRRQLDAREYEAMLEQADSACHPVKKVRSCFLWQDRYYQLDVFERPYGLTMLQAYIPLEMEIDSLPEFLPRPIVEVTEDPAYRLTHLATIKP